MEAAMTRKKQKETVDIWTKPVWTRAECARAIGVTERTFDRYRKLGIGPRAIRISGTLRWRRETVEAWLAKREVAA
jgi:predicted DNA-binding transcriptional regulator AlpA